MIAETTETDKNCQTSDSLRCVFPLQTIKQRATPFMLLEFQQILVLWERFRLWEVQTIPLTCGGIFSKILQLDRFPPPQIVGRFCVCFQPVSPVVAWCDGPAFVAKMSDLKNPKTAKCTNFFDEAETHFTLPRSATPCDVQEQSDPKWGGSFLKTNLG